MVAYPIPLMIPSLEPVRDAVESALRTYLAEAFDDITAASPTADAQGNPVAVDLVLPKEYRPAMLTDLAVNTVWPTCVITSSAAHMVESDSNGPGGLWAGTVQIEYWDQHTDRKVLARRMDRYAAALIAVVSLEDDNPLADLCQVMTDTFDLAYAEPGPPTPNVRAVGIRFDVQFRV